MIRIGIPLCLSILMTGCLGAAHPAAPEAAAASGQTSPDLPALSTSGPSPISTEGYVSDARMDELIACAQRTPGMPADFLSVITSLKTARPEAERVGQAKAAIEQLFIQLKCE